MRGPLQRNALLDPDDITDFSDYLRRSYLLSQQPMGQPTPEDYAAAMMATRPPQDLGGTQSADGTAPSQQSPQLLTGLYALGMSAMSRSKLDGSEGYYDDNAPDYSAIDPGPNPNLQLVARHLQPPGPGPLRPYGPDNPPPPPLTPTGQGAGPPSNVPGARVGNPWQVWRPQAPQQPSGWDQMTANEALTAQGLTPRASYTDPTVDALANTAQGRAVAPGEIQPDLSGRLPTETPDQYRKRRMVQSDLYALKDPRVRAYLDTMAFSEAFGYGGPLDYSSMYGDHPLGNRRTFSDFGSFPIGQGVAGRYQFEERTYNDLQNRLGISGMMPIVQDVMGVQLMREHGVLDRLLSDDFAGAVANSSPWASTPMLVNGQWTLRPKGSHSFTPFDQLQKYYQSRLREYASGG